MMLSSKLSRLRFNSTFLEVCVSQLTSLAKTTFQSKSAQALTSDQTSWSGVRRRREWSGCLSYLSWLSAMSSTQKMQQQGRLGNTMTYLSLEFGDRGYMSHPFNPDWIERLCHSRSLEPMRNFINLPLVNIDGCWWMLHEKHWLTRTKFGLFVILAPDSCLYNICLPFLSTYITLCFYCFTLRVVTGLLLYRDPTCRQCLYTCTPVINSYMLSNACQRSGAERKRPPFSLCVWQCSYYFLVNIWLYCTMNELHVDSASFLYHSS